MTNSTREPKTETATFAGGCFWCTEAIFQKLKGVTHVRSGYMGGTTNNPSYEEVSSGTSGHAEVIEIEFDPSQISYTTLLEVFFATHEPTSLNQQGADIGTQYRSAIFYHDQLQKELAEKFIKKLNTEKQLERPIVTTLEPAGSFYFAESYHQDFYNQNKTYSYCTIVIDPKIKKLYKQFSPLLKDHE